MELHQNNEALDETARAALEGPMVNESYTAAELQEIIDRLSRMTGQTLGVVGAIDASIAAMTRLKNQLVAPSTPAMAATENAKQPEPIIGASTAASTNGLFYGLGLPDAAFKQLSIAGGPQDAGEIWSALSATGFESAHNDPKHAVHNALLKRARRHGDVLAVGDGKWDLKSRYTEKELTRIEETRGGMAGRNVSRHRERTKNGMRKAAFRGVKFGPKRKVDLDIVSAMFRTGKSVDDVCAILGVTRAAIYRYFDKHAVRALWAEGRKEIVSDDDASKPQLRIVRSNSDQIEAAPSADTDEAAKGSGVSAPGKSAGSAR